MKSDFYVYLHIKETDNKVFYVGKGTGYRAWRFDTRNNFWKRTREKYGCKVEILFDNLTSDEALQLEKDAIQELRYFGHPLTNLTDGGDGCTGFVWSDASRSKLSSSKKGCVLTGETKEKLRQRNLGKKQSKETIDKRVITFHQKSAGHDKNTYLFYSKDDVFIGTRKQLGLFLKLPAQKFVKLFQGDTRKSAQGWSVLKINELLILKELIK